MDAEKATPQKAPGAVGRPRWMAAILFLISLFYLIPEIAFNAALVDVASADAIDTDALTRVEIFGRLISAFGVSLLVLDLILKGRLTHGVVRPVGVVGLTLLVVWPTVFYGQKIAINELIIYPASAEDRQAAYYLSLLKRAVVQNSLQIEGIPFDPGADTRATNKTFLALFGSLILGNNAAIDAILEHKEAIARRYIEDVAHEDFDAHYDGYRALRQQLLDSYRQFETSADAYQKATREADKQADPIFARIDGIIAAGYADYEAQRKRFYKDSDLIADELAYYIPSFFNTLEKCRNDGCRQRRLDGYQKKMRSLDLIAPDPNIWLIAEPIDYGASHYAGKLLQGILTAGLSVAGDAVAALSGNERPTHRYYHTKDPAHYREKVLENRKPRFLEQSGYPATITSKAQFTHHPETQQHLLKTLRAEGVDLPDTWNSDDKRPILQHVRNRHAKEASKSWSRQMDRQGLNLSPDADWNDFQRDKAIQQKIKTALGERFYQNPVSMDLNNQQFHQQIVVPAINKEAAKLIEQLSAETASFVPAGENFEAGEDALRSILIPPISIGLSLLLILIMLSKQPIKAYQLIVMKEREPSRKERTTFLAVTGISISIIVAYPLMALSNPFTEKTSTTHYLLKQLADNNQGGASKALTWILNMQPVFHPIGEAIEDGFGLVRDFHPTSGLLTHEVRWVRDRRGAVTAGEPTSSETYYDTVSVMVKAAPGSTIRIMNIRPVYSPRMMLPVGEYDIEVRSPGGHIARRWVTVDGREAELTVHFPY